MTKYPQAKVGFDDFKELVAAVEPHRAKRSRSTRRRSAPDFNGPGAGSTAAWRSG